MAENIPFVADYYETLGVPKDATPDQIKKSFRKLARECHPDVAGDDPEAARRFDRVRRAYETLSDPEARKAYDSRGRRRRRHRRGWTEDGYRMPGGFYVRRDGSGSMNGGPPPRPGANPTRTPRTRAHPSNGMDLNDIFGDFGFGGGGGASGAQARGGGDTAGAGSSGGAGGPPPDNRQSYGHHDAEGDRTGSPGSDITLSVDVPARVAQGGGIVTVEYPRLRLTEDGKAVARYDELHDLRLPPGARTGVSLRVPRMGNAGTDGTVGDLVCDLRVVADPPGTAPGGPSVDARQAGPEGLSGISGGPRSSGPRPRPRRSPPPPPPRSRRAQAAASSPSSSPSAASADEAVVDISVVDAILGGRVPVETPSGTVRLTIAPGTSGGTRLRLKGRGPGGADLYVRTRVVVPRALDDESRELIARFAQLNPDI